MPKKQGRRGNGEGTIKTRADGRKEGQIMLNGKRRYVYGTTEKEVREKLKELVRANDQGADLSQREIKVAAYLERWLEEVVKPTNSARTYDYYRSIIDRHINPAIGQLKLREVNPSVVSKLLAGLPGSLTNSTKGKIRGALRTALNNAVLWRLVDYNAAALVKPPKKITFQPHVVTPEEAARFRAAIREHTMEALYLLAITLGLRKGELLGLRKRDVDLNGGVLYIRGQAQSIGGKVVWTETKTPQSRRKLPLPRQLKEPLTKALTRQPDVEWLFPSEVGTLITPRNLSRQFKGLLKKAQLPETIRVHDLRHFAASNLLRNGARPEEARDVLGHTEVTTTLNIYAHAMPDEVGNAVEIAVNNLLGDDEPLK